MSPRPGETHPEVVDARATLRFANMALNTRLPVDREATETAHRLAAEATATLRRHGLEASK